jgi:hypothetical protein
MRSRRVRATGLIVSVVVTATAAQAQKVIRLYPGAAPGSESWTHKEKEYFSPIWNTQVVTNVAQPTLTADGEKACRNSCLLERRAWVWHA